MEYQERPSSEQLADLHVYIMPSDLWQKQLNSAVNNVIGDTVSAGFIRVLPEMRVYDLRAEIGNQLGFEIIPNEYVFLKSVGRCLTQVKARQELDLKVKSFLPPQAYLPEIFLLEATPEVKALTQETPRGLTSYSDAPKRPVNHYPTGHPSYSAGSYPENKQHGHYPTNPTGYQPNNGQGYGHINHPSQRQHVGSNNNNSQKDKNWLNDVDGTRAGDRAQVLSLQASHATQTESTRELGPPQTSITADDSGISEPTPDDPEYRRDNSPDGYSRQRPGDKRGHEDMTQRWVDDKYHQPHRQDDDRLNYDRQHNQDQFDEQRSSDDRNNGRHDTGQSNQWDNDDRRQGPHENESHQSFDKKWQDEINDDPRHQNNRYELQDDFPSPPPLQLGQQETESAKAERRQEKAQLLEELEFARKARKEVERKREELVRKAKQMQNKTNNRRNQARDMWKKRYFEEKKKTAPLESESNRLRHEIEVLHRRLMSQLETNKENRSHKNKSGNPSMKSNYKIQATKLQHNNDELKGKVEHAKMKLTAEIKLRNQAETELRALRAELTQRKINVTLTRSQQLAVLGGNQESPRTPRITPRS